VQYNYFLLRALCPILNERLHGFTLVSCFSQNKDELVFEFNNAERSFFIRALLDPAFTCITFPNNFPRARKNSIDLFNELVMQKVRAVQVIPFERSFTIELTAEYTLLFKLHGNRANILLLQAGAVKALFKQQLKGDQTLTVAALSRSIDWSEAAFHQHRQSVATYYNVLGKVVWSYLNGLGFAEAEADQQWKLFTACLHKLENPHVYLTEWHEQLTFSLLPIGKTVAEFADPIDALNAFATRYLSETAFVQTKKRVVSELQERHARLAAQLAEAEKRLTTLSTDRHFKTWGDIVMANLHRIDQGATELVAENFYANNEVIRIPLRKEWTPQKNAEVFYRKSKNQVIEIRQLEALCAARKTESAAVEKRLQEAQSAQSLKELSAFPDSTRPTVATSQPYHLHHIAGFQVLVGKHATANDLLLREHTHKNDLWLHAKDAAGSHVIIKHRAGHEFSKPLIESAAALAAYFSKRKTEGLVPVAYTLCKYVRKRKGDPPGAVVVEREETVLVAPAKPQLT
jgi:predicted ribosome quality control (RQC) complex YloA/Tae2 family protein